MRSARLWPQGAGEALQHTHNQAKRKQILSFGVSSYIRSFVRSLFLLVQTHTYTQNPSSRLLHEDNFGVGFLFSLARSPFSLPAKRARALFFGLLGVPTPPTLALLSNDHVPSPVLAACHQFVRGEGCLPPPRLGDRRTRAGCRALESFCRGSLLSLPRLH